MNRYHRGAASPPWRHLTVRRRTSGLATVYIPDVKYRRNGDSRPVAATLR
ncbi:hypothetical protein LI90_3472 [Carbonactinospora thermoautotrophica]|uniref:Uncharacterized protein n=1 Tax=Carbonactinospora thermoautotrophica TaxID=1469144 RepID=A0A132MX48_9ACTN|nr:hypothetical protein LI90_3472 [Carbonactinospora thermoautotrophica]